MEKTLAQAEKYIAHGMLDTAALILSASHRASGARAQKRIEMFIATHGMAHMFRIFNNCLIAA